MPTEDEEWLMFESSKLTQFTRLFPPPSSIKTTTIINPDGTTTTTTTSITETTLAESNGGQDESKDRGKENTDISQGAVAAGATTAAAAAGGGEQEQSEVDGAGETAGGDSGKMGSTDAKKTQSFATYEDIMFKVLLLFAKLCFLFLVFLFSFCRLLVLFEKKIKSSINIGVSARQTLHNTHAHAPTT